MGSVLATSSSGGGSGSGSGSSGRAAHGATWADIREHGAVAGAGGAAATRAAIQAAIDATSNNGQATVYLPSVAGGWHVNRPIFMDRDNVRLAGDGRGQTTLQATGGFAPVICGVKRVPTALEGGDGGVIDATYRVDLHGYGDLALAGTAGVLYGYRTHGDAVIAFPTGPFTIGPPGGWTACSYLRIEFAVDLATAVIPVSNAVIFGMMSQTAVSPWCVTYNAGTRNFGFSFTTADGINRFLTFGDGGGTPGIARVALQVDLTAGTAQAWTGRVQRAVDATSAGPGWGSTLNQTFHDRSYAWMVIANQAARLKPYDGSAPAATSAGYSDLTVLGLRMCTTPCYVDRGAGQAQTRIDAQAVSDFNSYLNDGGSGLLDFLSLDSTPADPVPRHVPCGYSSGLLLNLSNGNNYDSVQGCGVEDMTLLSAPFGAGLLMGLGTDHYFNRVEFLGGTYGFGTLNLGANYTHVFTGCLFSAIEASYYGLMSIFWVNDSRVTGCGRYGFHLAGCSPNFRNVSMPPSGPEGRAPEYALKGRDFNYGGCYEFDDFVCDFESENPPSKATIEIEAETATAATYLIFRNSVSASTSPTAPFLSLLAHPEAEGQYQLAAALVFECVQPFSVGAALIRTNSRTWRGRVACHTEGPPGPLIENTASDGVGGIVFEHTVYTAPPRLGVWATDSHELAVLHPVDGQYRLWSCPVGGRYGTMTGPSWAGHQPLDRTRSGDALAAYVDDRTWWTIGGSSQPGMWSDYARCLHLNWLFRGTVPPTRVASLALCGVPLTIVPVPTSATSAEISGSGYARKALTSSNVAASSSGISTNSTTLSFGPLAAGATVGAVAVYDADGNYLAEVRAASSSVVASGGTYSVPGGTLTTGHGTDCTLGAFTHAAINTFNDFLLRNTALPTAPTLYLALSTGLASTSGGPSEPSGNGYARVAAPSSSWSVASPSAPYGDVAATWNTAALTFPAATGAWGTVRSVYLMDAASGGNVLAAASLTINRAVNAGDPAKSFAPGALRFMRA